MLFYRSSFHTYVCIPALKKNAATVVAIIHKVAQLLQLLLLTAKLINSYFPNSDSGQMSFNIYVGVLEIYRLTQNLMIRHP